MTAFAVIFLSQDCNKGIYSLPIRTDQTQTIPASDSACLFLHLQADTDLRPIEETPYIICNKNHFYLLFCKLILI